MLVQGSAGARGVGGVTVNHVHGTATNPIAQAGAVGARAAINGTGMGARPGTNMADRMTRRKALRRRVICR